MAGREHSGFTYAKKSLFNNASMIFTPTRGPIESMEKLKKLSAAMGEIRGKYGRCGEYGQCSGAERKREEI